MIVNELSAKTHEITGNKPAKLEINNKQNMTMISQYPYNPPTENQINQMNQWFRQKLLENACLPDKRIVLIINDLSAKTHEITGNKPAKPEINNKSNMSPCHSTAICKSVAGLPLNTVNLFQDDTQPTSCKS